MIRCSTPRTRYMSSYTYLRHGRNLEFKLKSAYVNQTNKFSSVQFGTSASTRLRIYVFLICSFVKIQKMTTLAKNLSSHSTRLCCARAPPLRRIFAVVTLVETCQCAQYVDRYSPRYRGRYTVANQLSTSHFLRQN